MNKYQSSIINDYKNNRISFKDCHETLANKYDAYWREQRQKERLEEELRIKRIALREARCKKVTKALSIVFMPIFVPIKWTFSNFLKLTKAFFKNLRIFIAYMWELVKARKQGVCPYLRFTESDQSSKK